MEVVPIKLLFYRFGSSYSRINQFYIFANYILDYFGENRVMGTSQYQSINTNFYKFLEIFPGNFVCSCMICPPFFCKWYKEGAGAFKNMNGGIYAFYFF